MLQSDYNIGTGQEYSDLLWEECERDQAEAKLHYEHEREQQQ